MTTVIMIMIMMMAMRMIRVIDHDHDCCASVHDVDDAFDDDFG